MFHLVGNNWPQRPLLLGVETGSQVDVSSTVTVNVPADVVDGDLLILITHHDRTSTPSDPSGWTLQTNTTVTLDGTSKAVGLFTRIASSEPASYGIVFSNQNEKVALIAAYRYATDTSIDTTLQTITSTTDTTHTATSVTPAEATRETLLFYAFLMNRDGTNTVLDPGDAVPGMVNRGFIGEEDTGIVIYDETKLPTGATGARVLTTPNACGVAVFKCVVPKHAIITSASASLATDEWLLNGDLLNNVGSEALVQDGGTVAADHWESTSSANDLHCTTSAPGQPGTDDWALIMHVESTASYISPGRTIVGHRTSGGNQQGWHLQFLTQDNSLRWTLDGGSTSQNVDLVCTGVFARYAVVQVRLARYGGNYYISVDNGTTSAATSAASTTADLTSLDELFVNSSQGGANPGIVAKYSYLGACVGSDAEAFYNNPPEF